MARTIRVLVGDSGVCLGAAEGRVAELIVLLLRHADRINQRGTRKLVIDEVHGALFLSQVVKTRLGAPVPDCAGMEAS